MTEPETRELVTKQVNKILLRCIAWVSIANLAALSGVGAYLLNTTKVGAEKKAEDATHAYLQKHTVDIEEKIKNARERERDLAEIGKKLYEDVGIARGYAIAAKRTVDQVAQQADAMQERITGVSKVDQEKLDAILKQLNQGQAGTLLESFGKVSHEIETLKKQLGLEREQLHAQDRENSQKIEKLVQQFEQGLTAGESVKLEPLPGWSFYLSDPKPAYRKSSEGIVYLEGFVLGDGTGNNDKSPPIFRLPPGFRPSQKRDYAVAAGRRGGSINIEPDGRVEFSHITKDWVSLDGISFPVASK